MSGQHPLVETLRRSLGRQGRRNGAVLEALSGRLAVLARLAEGRPPDWSGEPRARRATASFLRRRAGRWHDGDENAVREWLDRWRRSEDEDPAVATAAALLRAADRLAAAEPRPEALWFYLWELQTRLAGLAPGDPADTAARPC